MLHKAKPKPKRRLNSKGHNLSRMSLDIRHSSIGKALTTSIPVLSIFALLGMMTFLFLLDTSINNANNVYAAETINNPNTPMSSALTIDNYVENKYTSAGRDKTFYFDYNVSVKATNVAEYTLTIAGPEDLTNAKGGTNGTIAGTEAATTGEDIEANHWGYAWTDTTTSNNDSSITYTKLDGEGAPIKLDTKTFDNDNTTNNTEYTKKIVFASKFGQDAEEGHYTANIKLSLVTTPKTLVLGLWNTNGETKDSGITTMQEMTAKVCEQVVTPTSANDIPEMLLKDSRDGSVYSVAKLLDGKCWMTQNLSLAAGTTINSDNSDLNGISSYTLPTNTEGAFVEDNTKQQMRNADNDTYGAYYSWCAATANTCQIGGTAIGANTDATSSICPKGWKLPKGTPGNGTNDFANAMGMSTADITVNGNFWDTVPVPTLSGGILTKNGTTWLAAGLVYNGGLGYTGSSGCYWSRTASSTVNAYLLNFRSGNLTPADSNTRYIGFSVRCVADDTGFNGIEYMQDMTPEICSRTAAGATTILTDSRDDNAYTVQKIGNQCWMTQNLRLTRESMAAKGTTLTGGISGNSNIASTPTFTTLPSSTTAGFINYNQSYVYYPNNAKNGAYYSWYTATAGKGTDSISSGEVNDSICPKGWFLPASGIGIANDFAKAMGITISVIMDNMWDDASYPDWAANGGNAVNPGILTVNGNTWVAAGYYSSGSSSNVGTYGFYWSRTAYGAKYAYRLSFSNSDLTPARSSNKYNGFSVRCVAYSS